MLYRKNTSVSASVCGQCSIELSGGYNMSATSADVHKLGLNLPTRARVVLFNVNCWIGAVSAYPQNVSFLLLHCK